jgi:hypothetical protein
MSFIVRAEIFRYNGSLEQKTSAIGLAKLYTCIMAALQVFASSMFPPEYKFINADVKALLSFDLGTRIHGLRTTATADHDYTQRPLIRAQTPKASKHLQNA